MGVWLLYPALTARDCIEHSTGIRPLAQNVCANHELTPIFLHMIHIPRFPDVHVSAKMPQHCDGICFHYFHLQCILGIPRSLWVLKKKTCSTQFLKTFPFSSSTYASWYLTFLPCINDYLAHLYNQWSCEPILFLLGPAICVTIEWSWPTCECPVSSWGKNNKDLGLD